MSKRHTKWPAEDTAGLVATDHLIAGDSEEEDWEEEEDKKQEEEEDSERRDEQNGYSE